MPPPTLAGLAREILDRFKKPPPLLDSFEQARDLCGPGYEHPALIDMVSRKTELLPELIRQGTAVCSPWLLLSLALAGAPSRPVSVLDLGGALGMHYLQARAVFQDADLRWAVVESKAMAQRGRERFASAALSFHEETAAAAAQLGDLDVVHASGALQYLPDAAGALRELVGLGARFLVLTRLRLTAGDRALFSVQTSRLSSNGPGPAPAGIPDAEVTVPLTFLPVQQVRSTVGARYRVRLMGIEGAQPCPAGARGIQTYVVVAEATG